MLLLHWDKMKCPDYKRCLDFRVSTFRGSTVYHFMISWVWINFVGGFTQPHPSRADVLVVRVVFMAILLCWMFLITGTLIEGF